MKTGRLLFIAGLLLVALLVVAAYFLTVGRQAAQLPPPTAALPQPQPQQAEVTDATPPPPPQPELRILRADGVVEMRFGSARWHAARGGDTLQPGQQIRTAPDGSADVALGDGVRLRVQRDSEVQLDESNGDVARVIVGRGLVTVEVDPTSGKLVQIATRGGDAVAETRDGTLSVLADGAGQLAVAATRGSAKVTAQGQSVTLKAGELTVAEKGRAPMAPVALPASLLVKLSWPSQSTTATKRHRISGKTIPGTLVRVAGKLVAAGADGKFEVVVELREGDNRIAVQAVDVLGRDHQSSSPVIELDTKAPAQAFETDPSIWRHK